jgi:hypothetical protein
MTEQATYKTLEAKLGQPKYPFHYHNVPVVEEQVEVLRKILNDRKLEALTGKPIQFTADKLDVSGTVVVDGFSDPSFDILFSRKFEPRCVIFAFTGDIMNNSTYQPRGADMRYARVQSTDFGPLAAIIVYKEDLELVQTLVQESGLDILVVLAPDWQSYVNKGSGGLALSEEKE